MSKFDYYEIEYTGEFSKELKRLVRKKKYKQLPDQLVEVEKALSEGNFLGTKTTQIDFPVKYEIYKHRMPNLDTKTGKSGGYRVLYIVVTEHKILIMMAIYSKTETESLTDAYIDGLVSGLLGEFNEVDDETTV